MRTNKFKKITTNLNKHQLVWKIVKGDLKVDSKNKDKNLTKRQYDKILNMEG